MGSSKSKLQISNSEVLKEARQLQGVSSQSFRQVSIYSISYHGLSLPDLIISFTMLKLSLLSLLISLLISSKLSLR